MANWMKQTVTIYSEKKDKLETIKDYLKTENSADVLLIFDLNNLVRMPKNMVLFIGMTGVMITGVRNGMLGV